MFPARKECSPQIESEKKSPKRQRTTWHQQEQSAAAPSTDFTPGSSCCISPNKILLHWALFYSVKISLIVKQNKSTNQTSNPLAKKAPLMYKFTADKRVPSSHCFCFLFLENMIPMRPMAARPTPAMPATLMASLTWKREEGG